METETAGWCWEHILLHDENPCKNMLAAAPRSDIVSGQSGTALQASVESAIDQCFSQAWSPRSMSKMGTYIAQGLMT